MNKWSLQYKHRWGESIISTDAETQDDAYLAYMQLVKSPTIEWVKLYKNSLIVTSHAK